MCWAVTSVVAADKVCYLLVAGSGCVGEWALWGQLVPCCVLQDTGAHPHCCPAWVFSDRTQRSCI